MNALNPIQANLRTALDAVAAVWPAVIKLEAERGELVAALAALCDWAREHTSPRDANSPHQLLVEARAVLAKVQS
jgi:hypothetical protein